jgi:hypothetical protein
MRETQYQTIQSNASGELDFDISVDLDVGVHVIRLTDTDTGETVHEVVNVLPDRGVVTEQGVTPPASGMIAMDYTLLVVGGVLLLGALLLFVLSRKRGDKSDNSDSIDSADSQTVTVEGGSMKRIFAVVSLILGLVSIGAFVYSNGFLGRLGLGGGSTVPAITEPFMITGGISGRVLDVEGEPISGVDISVSGSSVRTSVDGVYDIAGLSDNMFIRINHPKLMRSFRKFVDSPDTMDILFDVDLYNMLHFIVDAESRSKFNQILLFMTSELKDSVLDSTKFQSYESIFGDSNISDQYIDILSISTLDKYEPYSVALLGKEYREVVQVVLVVDGHSEIYYFHRSSSGWKLVELPVMVSEVVTR